MHAPFQHSEYLLLSNNSWLFYSSITSMIGHVTIPTGQKDIFTAPPFFLSHVGWLQSL
ncbi:hypothetical protein COCSADRAFT_258467 [Bipolaris sorokiniana ND90Pr]|uniref:Uncharacterized protein n=1 Tax=Cochliobolus sativus (strain ND90Pr / ATCC 201652) TaxID=665912 RepID=M2QWE3_COCSN|nr:uncharacterized protein COCSADRAFT_258467 [Bipolaris sorokiniana ND90Pr]EMD59424.1 hypothetical protein COCSADRAFT_258467 [Bipolaris sorokiniana ND90Pr]